MHKQTVAVKWQRGKGLLFIGVVVFLALLVVAAAHIHKVQAACAAPSTDYGQSTMTISVPSSGTYRAWSRIKAPDTANNSYLLEVDGGNCYTVGDSSITANTWTWVDYQGGTTSSKINLNLTAGNHILKLIGREAGVSVDRVILTSDPACVPTGTGDNCASGADVTKPASKLDSPANGSTLSGTVNMTATASDNIKVTKVEFYRGFNIIGSDDTAPYSVDWDTKTAPDGSHPVFAKAYDAAGNQGDSAIVSVTVDNTVPDTPPTTTLQTPANNAIIRGTVPLNAVANDDVGVNRVEFYNYIFILGTDTTSPYGINWDTTTVGDGSYSIFSKAYDSAGNQGNSSVVSVKVDNTAPTTAVATPAAGATLSGAQAVTANAADINGIAKVELYIDGVLSATDTAAPYSYSWNTTSHGNGNHALTTKAYDAAGNVTTSAAINVVVNNTVVTPKNGDVTGDGKIDVFDLSRLLVNWGKSGQTYSQGDITGDGVVNVFDLSILLANWGK